MRGGEAELLAVEGDGSGHVTVTDFGTREFPTLDLDGNLVTFFRWEAAAAAAS